MQYIRRGAGRHNVVENFNDNCVLFIFDCVYMSSIGVHVFLLMLQKSWMMSVQKTLVTRRLSARDNIPITEFKEYKLSERIFQRNCNSLLNFARSLYVKQAYFPIYLSQNLYKSLERALSKNKTIDCRCLAFLDFLNIHRCPYDLDGGCELVQIQKKNMFAPNPSAAAIVFCDLYRDIIYLGIGLFEFLASFHIRGTNVSLNLCFLHANKRYCCSSYNSSKLYILHIAAVAI